MDEIYKLILKDDPEIFDNKDMTFKSNMLKFAVENHCFKIADFMQNTYFVSITNVDKDKVLSCDLGKEWVYRNDLFLLSDIFNYDLEPKLLSKWVKDKFTKKHQSLDFLLENVNKIPEKHLKYLYKHIEPSILNPTFLKLSNEKYIIKFIKKGASIKEPQYINSNFKKVWSWFFKTWKNMNEENQNLYFQMIAENCESSILLLFLDDVKIKSEHLHVLLLRVGKSDDEELLNTVDKFIKKSVKTIDKKEFSSWYTKRRRTVINNHDIYLLLENDFEINKKLSNVSTSIFLMKKCVDKKIIVNEKALLEFVENTNDKNEITIGIKIAKSSGTKIGSNIQSILESKNISNFESEKKNK